MPNVRTLPIHNAPLAGEVLESWLAVTADRFQVTWGELMEAIVPDSSTLDRAHLSNILTPDEEDEIGHATAIRDPQLLQRMTLANYGQPVVTIDPTTRKAITPWGEISRQRYCPRCLLEKAGRWQLSWRLPWSVVCFEHRCFLNDVCPECRGAQRIDPTWFRAGMYPKSFRCNRITERRRCPGDLRTARISLVEDCLVLGIHRSLQHLVTGLNVETGIYASVGQVTVDQFLADLRMLTARILRSCPPSLLARIFCTAAPVGDAHYWSRWNTLPSPIEVAERRWFGWDAGAPAIAAGSALAVAILLQPDEGAAVAMLSEILRKESARRISAQHSLLGRHSSAVLTHLDEAAVALPRNDHHATFRLTEWIAQACADNSLPGDAGPSTADKVRGVQHRHQRVEVALIANSPVVDS